MVNGGGHMREIIMRIDARASGDLGWLILTLDGDEVWIPRSEAVLLLPQLMDALASGEAVRRSAVMLAFGGAGHAADS